MDTVARLSAELRAGRLGAGELCQDVLARLDAWGPGAVAELLPERARAEAAEAERRLARGEGGPLTGVPVAVKELTRVAGARWSGGSAALEPVVAEADDEIVTRLRAAGAVVVATTTAPELGLPCYTEPEGRPPAATPFDPRRSAGGSSGGAAAVVAAGAVPLAHGSDGGGSIRLPAACCGVVGMKPSVGLLGPAGQPAPQLVSHGVLTTDVASTALVLSALGVPGLPASTSAAGWEPVEGSGSSAGPQPPGTGQRGTGQRGIGQRGIGGLRIGVLTDPLIVADVPVHPGARRAVTRTADRLDALGHRVTPVAPAFGPEHWAPFRALWGRGALAAPVPPEAEHRLRPLTRWLREIGRACDDAELARAVEAAATLARRCERAWAEVDVVLCPTMAQPPWCHGALRDDADPAADFEAQTRQTPWCSTWNLTGGPSISLPLHAEPVDGVELPFGVLLSARPGADAQLLSLAAQLLA